MDLEEISVFGRCGLMAGSKDDRGEQDFHSGVADAMNFETDEGFTHIVVWQQ